MSEVVRSEVVRWDTPFSDAWDPAVRPLAEIEADADLTLLVYPQGRGRYPAFIVRFESAPWVLLTHETNAPVRPEWEAGGGFGVASCTYRWLNSPQLRECGRVGRDAVFNYAGLPMQHFVIAGADWLVDVISAREPSIVEFNGSFRLVDGVDA